MITVTAPGFGRDDKEFMAIVLKCRERNEEIRVIDRTRSFLGRFVPPYGDFSEASPKPLQSSVAYYLMGKVSSDLTPTSQRDLDSRMLTAAVLKGYELRGGRL
jgi:hypothetical protein